MVKLLQTPIHSYDIHGLFVKSDDGDVLDPKSEEAIAEKINSVCEEAVIPKGVWMNPEHDRQIAHINNVPLEIGGVAVRWVPNDEYGFLHSTKKVA